MNKPSKHKEEITSGEIIYREGDKILQLVNDQIILSLTEILVI